MCLAAVARRISDDLAVMYAGVIVERGTLEQVFAAPQHAYTRELLAAPPSIYPRAVRAEMIGESTDRVDPHQ